MLRTAFAVLVLAVIAACSSPVAPAGAKQAPTQVAAGRYILISGRQGGPPPYPDCYQYDAKYWYCPNE